jgi:hypothetical protein
MTRNEVLQRIEEAVLALREYKRQGLGAAYSDVDRQKNQQIQTASVELITEARTVGAAGSVCPRCGGSGRA